MRSTIERMRATYDALKRADKDFIADIPLSLAKGKYCRVWRGSANRPAGRAPEGLPSGSGGSMTLTDRIAEVCPIQARRYERLTEAAHTIARDGIIRHFDACDRYGVEPDKGAIREIIDDAQIGRAVYAETVK